MTSMRSATSPVMWKKSIDQLSIRDRFCFQCHQRCLQTISCQTCPRVFHPNCLTLTEPVEPRWSCPECQELRQPSSHCQADLQLLFETSFKRVKAYAEVENIHMLRIIEKQLETKQYSSIGAFLADFKWLQHNVAIQNGNRHKLTNFIGKLIQMIYDDVKEFQLCSQCYVRRLRLSSSNWFVKVCRPPHMLCWAKMESYRPWPAKVFRICEDLVDVRFFGQHDRAWVPLQQCFVLSKEYPNIDKMKSSKHFDDSLKELEIHINLFKKVYGDFIYAPLHTRLNQEKPFKFYVPINESNSSSAKPVPHRRRHPDKSQESETHPKRTRFSTNDATVEIQPVTNDTTSNIFETLQVHTNHSMVRSERNSHIRYLLEKYTSQPEINENKSVNLCSFPSLDHSFVNMLPPVPLRPLSTSSTNSIIFEGTDQPNPVKSTDLPEKATPASSNSWLSALSIDQAEESSSNFIPNVPSNLALKIDEAHYRLRAISDRSSVEIKEIICDLNDRVQQLLTSFNEEIQSLIERERFRSEKSSTSNNMPLRIPSLNLFTFTR